MEPIDTEVYRRRVLASLGASPAVVDELIAFADLKYRPLPARPAHLPLEDEPHAEPWDRYAHAATDRGVLDELKDRFPQLRFPIREGMSQEPAYRAATLSGDVDAARPFEPGIVLERPDDVSLAVWPSMGGGVPVLALESRADFETFVRVFTERNEPAPIPASVGAMIVAGLNNWDRIREHREAWERAGGPDSGTWGEEFRRLAARKDQYQDRLILVSSGPYSDVTADYAGLDPLTWRERSVVLRREHEFTHYFIYRLCGSLRTSVLDELLADFAGLIRAFGRYRPELARRFLGLERFPHYRDGGRLEYYHRHAPLSPEAFRILAMLVWMATGNLALVWKQWERPLQTTRTLASIIFALGRLSLEACANEDLVRVIEPDVIDEGEIDLSVTRRV